MLKKQYEKYRKEMCRQTKEFMTIKEWKATEDPARESELINTVTKFLKSDVMKESRWEGYESF